MAVYIKLVEREGWDINKEKLNNVIQDIGEHHGCMFDNKSHQCPCVDYLLNNVCCKDLYVRNIESILSPSRPTKVSLEEEIVRRCIDSIPTMQSKVEYLKSKLQLEQNKNEND